MEGKEEGEQMVRLKTEGSRGEHRQKVLGQLLKCKVGLQSQREQRYASFEREFLRGNGKSHPFV